MHPLDQLTQPILWILGVLRIPGYSPGPITLDPSPGDPLGAAQRRPIAHSNRVEQLTQYTHLDQLTQYTHLDQLTKYTHLDQLTQYTHLDQLTQYTHLDQLTQYTHLDQLTHFVRWIFVVLKVPGDPPPSITSGNTSGVPR